MTTEERRWRVEKALKQKGEKGYREDGKVAGLEWAKKADFSDLWYALQCNNRIHTRDSFRRICYDLRDYTEGEIPDYGIELVNRRGDITPNSLFQNKRLGQYFSIAIKADPLMYCELDEEFRDGDVNIFVNWWLRG